MSAGKVQGLALERHYVGALLVGAVELHDDVDLHDPDMRAVVHAITIAQGWSTVRPAPAEDVAAALHSLGYPAPAALLIWLMESWDVARERATRLAILTMLLRAAQDAANAEAKAEASVYDAIDRLYARRDHSSAVHALLAGAA